MASHADQRPGDDLQVTVITDDISMDMLRVVRLGLRASIISSQGHNLTPCPPQHQSAGRRNADQTDADDSRFQSPPPTMRVMRLLPLSLRRFIVPAGLSAMEQDSHPEIPATLLGGRRSSRAGTAWPSLGTDRISGATTNSPGRQAQPHGCHRTLASADVKHPASGASAFWTDLYPTDRLTREPVPTIIDGPRQGPEPPGVTRSAF
jgi:hypothetical protein